MKNEQEILKTLKAISGRMDDGFRDIRDAIGEMERRVTALENLAKQTAGKQIRQGEEIEKLKEIVQILAASDDGIKRSDGTAIHKEPAYAEFEKCGIGKRTAMKELKDAGAIKTDCEGKTTCVVRVGGKLQRLIIVCGEG